MPVYYQMTNDSGCDLFMGFAWYPTGQTNIGSSVFLPAGTVGGFTVPYAQTTNGAASLYVSQFDLFASSPNFSTFDPIAFSMVDSGLSYDIKSVPEPGQNSFFFTGNGTVCDLVYSALSSPFNASVVFLVGAVACLLVFKWSKRAVQPGQTFTRYQDSSGRWRGRHH